MRKFYLLVAVLSCTLLGCGSDALVEPQEPDPSRLFWDLHVNYTAVMLSTVSPYNTVKIVATPLSAHGDTLTANVQLRFRKLSDLDTAISVDSTGLITAKVRTNVNSKVEVEAVVGNITHRDTVTVMVKDDPDVAFLDSVTIQPPPSDSVWRWLGYAFGTSWQNWRKAYRNESALPTSQWIVDYSYSNRGVVECVVQVLGMCNVASGSWVWAQVFAYDRLLIDSVFLYRIPPRVNVVVFTQYRRPDGSVFAQFSPRELSIKRGNTVFFLNRAVRTNVQCHGLNSARFTSIGDAQSGFVDSTDITFESPESILPGRGFGSLVYAHPCLHEIFGYNISMLFTGGGFPAGSDGGNIPAFGHRWMTGSLDEIDPGWRSRQFPTNGVYRYASSRYPEAIGTIIVSE